MDRQTKFTYGYIAACLAAAAAFCFLTLRAMVHLISWYISSCGESTVCSIAEFTISYWWVLFVPACLLAAYLLRKDYDRRVQCLTGPADHDA